ncbi:replication regulatory protein RepA [Serratia marcescens]|uniref:replication regulatory protein RepA n=1 Tax=Serratia marcescens TaxID=615 RepID=UPI0007C9852F|nr:replication regulatory protein RepA [Serratia marcescens]OAH32789.1 replication protein [Serratia marcescens]
MSQAVNAVTPSSKTKRQYRKGNAMTASEKQLASIARKRATHKEINVFVRNPLKEQLIELCSDEGLTQGQMIEMLIEREANRRLAKK